MENSAHCVIDVGTGGVKCLVFDEGGLLLFKENGNIDLQIEGPGKSFNPRAVWEDVCLMTSRAARECSKRKKRIVSVSSTSMREGNVFYDREGKELLAVPNLDARAYKEAEEVQDTLGEAIYLASGHWPSAIFLASRLKFLRKQPALFERIKKVSMINDWLLYKFSGVLATEPTNGCETTLFSLKERNWSDELIEEFRFDRSLFPEVRECGTPLGQVTSAASRKSGLRESTLVVVGAADTEAAVAGCGLFESGNVAAIAGTTTPIQAVTDVPILDEKRKTWTCCHVLPDRWTVESNAGATGLVFKWWSEMTGMTFPKLDEEVVKEKPVPGSVKVNIGATLMNAKHPHPVSGGIQGLSSWTPRVEVTLGILEANCFSVKANLEQLESVLGRRFAELYFCGGASNSKLWRRLQASILGRTIVSFNIGEATGRGAAMLSAVVSGEFSNLREASGYFVKRNSSTKPIGQVYETYDPLYQDWLNAQSS
jgi:autoinducer-2 kinase